MPKTASLKTYQEKRDFARTAEPKGRGRGKPTKGKTGGWRYVVQKHDARRLHFDFRLELDGVLKSWAVTRGPSLNPADKRLAVRVEDHPVEYGSFEGTIPKGEYGGGTVMLWDEGHWTPQGDPHEGLEKGVLKFELDGNRLKGGFALVRLRSDDKGKRENWLLIKERDAYADPKKDPIKAWTTSVTTGRSMAEIADDDPPDAPKDAPASKAKGKLPKAKGKLPKFIAPELATLVGEPPAGDDWLHEIKYDGYRAISAIGGGQVKIYTRSGQDWTKTFGPIAAALAKLDVASALLDGEIVVLDEKGRSSFAALQHSLKHGSAPLTYFVFDILALDGKDLRKLPLVRRKEALRKLLDNAPSTIRYSEDVVGHGAEVFKKACQMGLEGIVSKRAGGAYVSRRTRGWLKTKCQGNDEFVIGGYRISDKKGRPFASLLLGEYIGNELHYRGRVGTGFDQKLMDALSARMAKLKRKTCPFVDADRDAGKDAQWIEPKLVAQIAYTERTREGRLRHPAFLGLRTDKPAKDVQYQAARS